MANLIRLEQEAHRKDFEGWHSAMSYKIFLLEKELGYKIDADSNGLIMMERINMLERYWEETKRVLDGSSDVESKIEKTGLMK